MERTLANHPIKVRSPPPGIQANPSITRLQRWRRGGERAAAEPTLADQIMKQPRPAPPWHADLAVLYEQGDVLTPDTPAAW